MPSINISSRWFDSAGIRTHDLPHNKPASALTNSVWQCETSSLFVIHHEIQRCGQFLMVHQRKQREHSVHKLSASVRQALLENPRGSSASTGNQQNLIKRCYCFSHVSKFVGQAIPILVKLVHIILPVVYMYIHRYNEIHSYNRHSICPPGYPATRMGYKSLHRAGPTL